MNKVKTRGCKTYPKLHSKELGFKSRQSVLEAGFLQVPAITLNC